ncbi:MAG: SRPBCC family protein [Gemmatimonadales bacterium]
MLPRSSAVLALAFAVVGPAAGPLAAQEVRNTSYIYQDSIRVLQQSVIVPASVGEVWTALTTSDGLRSWAVPVAQADLRVGGIMESSYDPKARIGDPANIRSRYLSYVPQRMVSFQVVSATPGFEHGALLAGIHTVLELDAVDSTRTRVIETMVGYRPGPGYDTLYRHFEWGNDWSLKQLHRRFAVGPADWTALTAETSASKGGKQ